MTHRMNRYSRPARLARIAGLLPVALALAAFVAPSAPPPPAPVAALPAAPPVPLAHQGLARVCQLVGEVERATGQPTLNRTESRFGFWGTDLGASFTHKGRTVLLFGDTHVRPGLARPKDVDFIASTTDTNPEDCLSLDVPLAPDGGFQPFVLPDTYQGAFGVPTGGFSVNGRMHVVASAEVAPGNVMARSVLATSDDDGRTFTVRHELSRDRFINVAPAVVERRDVPGLPPGEGQAVLMWGSGRYRASDPFLAVLPADRADDKAALRYFAGLDPAGAPRWSEREADSQPLFNQPCLGEMSVSWDPRLNRWLMLYNCGGPRSHQILMRSALQPWGPWSAPQVLFDPERDGGFCEYINPGPLRMVAQPVGRVCAARGDPHVPDAVGDAYGPYLLAGAGRVSADGRGSDIYFLMSTWNPYTVVLMRATLSLAPGS